MTLFAPLKRYRRKWRAQQDWSLRDSLWGEIGTGLRGQLYLDRGDGPAAFACGRRCRRLTGNYRNAMFLHVIRHFSSFCQN